MKLYFLRHATATDKAPTDALRALTREGRREARSAGMALARMGVEPDMVLASPLVRARQTAQLAAGAIGIPSRRVAVLDQLKNGTTTGGLLRALEPYAHLQQVLLVGHVPSFPEHIAVLTGSGRAEALRMGKGAIACVTLEALSVRSGTLRWLMGKKQLRQLSGR